MSVDQLKSNLTVVRERIREAEIRAGRPEGCVRMVGVTKYVDADVIRQLVAAGCTELGENRPQSLWEKAEVLIDQPIVWHLIGHLQRNKVKRTVEVATLIHSVDSDRLVTAIDIAAAELALTAQILLEVNVSGESAKHGYALDELKRAIETVAQCSHVEVVGLMCMAGLESNEDQTRREFAALRQSRDSLAQSLPANVTMKELSMGMSGDFEIAIQEGATIVRIGSLLFEGLAGH